jgi:hypothetical protein
VSIECGQNSGFFNVKRAGTCNSVIIVLEITRAVCSYDGLARKQFRFVVLPSSTYSQQVSRLFSLDHIQTHTTVGRTPLDEGSARRRDLYLTTQTLYKTNIQAPGGIRTHDPSKRSTADLRLRPRGHWDRPSQIFVYI